MTLKVCNFHFELHPHHAVLYKMELKHHNRCPLQNVKYFNFGPSATDTLCRLFLVLDGVETFTMSDALKLDYEFSNHHEKNAQLQARTKH